MTIGTTSHYHLVIDDSAGINGIVDAVVAALILEGYNVSTIHQALLEKAESMELEFNLKGDDHD